MYNMKICCLTGHRPKGFPWDYEDKNLTEHKSYLAALRDKVIGLILSGYNYFISGGALGADTDFAETIIGLRDSVYPHIALEIAVPCPNQDLKWRNIDKRRYKAICKAADCVNIVSDKYSDFCMQRRNEYMVDKSDLVLVVWNGERQGGTFNTFRYAQRKDTNLTVIDLEEFIE